MCFIRSRKKYRVQNLFSLHVSQSPIPCCTHNSSRFSLAHLKSYHSVSRLLSIKLVRMNFLSASFVVHR